MADISKITLPDNTTYNIKDNNARNFTNTPYYEQDEEALMFQLGDSYMTGEQDNQPYSFRAAGGSAEIGNREYDKIVGGTVAWNQAVRDSASENETDFAPIVTVTDAVEDVAAVKVKIEPVQDLHGYDHPWPAGGSANLLGGEKLAENINEVCYAVWNKAEKTIRVALNAQKLQNDDRDCFFSTGVTFEENTQYTLIIAGTASGFANVMFRYTDGTDDRQLGRGLVVGVNVSLAGKTVEGVVYRAYNGGTIFNYENCGLFKGSVTAADFVPYSNICPITGWTGAKVTRTGKNLLEGLISAASMGETGNISNSNLYYCQYGYVKSGVTYYTNSVLRAFYTTVPEKGISSSYDGKRYNTSDSFVAPIDGYVCLRFGNDVTTPMLSLDESEYEPYQGQTYSITLPTEAGTVYGGTLDVTTGELVVDMAEVDLGTLNWTTGSSGRHSTTNVSNIKGVPNTQVFSALCSNYQSVSGNTVSDKDQTIGMVNGYLLQINDSAYNGVDAATFKTAMDGVQLVYELATPINYILTPTEVRTLLGTNNVWADTGDLALTYTGTDEYLTLKSGRKYLTRISGTDSMLLGSGQEITVGKGTNNVFDITQMFGTTIADYIYSLEQTTPGAGVAWFRKLFPKPYYEYNAGELMSVQAVAHKIVGFNAWDEEWELGIINTTTGEEIDSSSNIRSKNYIHVIPGATYYFKLGTTDISNNVVFYDAEKNYMTTLGEHVDDTFTVPENAHYMKFYMSTNYGSTYLSNICINLSGNGERDGEYEEYKMHSYPLDSSLILRGIPKLDANNQLYYDGDVYEADGTVTRKYAQETITIVGAGPTRARMAIATTLKNRHPYNRTVAVICNKIITNVTSEIDDVSYISCRLSQDSNATMWFFFPLNVVSTINEAKAWFAQNKVKVVYELATPTTETAEPYDNPQIVDSEGTEEYITTNIVFVGHETKY